MTPQASLVSFLAVVAFGATLCNAASCFPKFKKTEVFMNVGQTCTKMLADKGIDLKSISQSAADLQNKNMDDHCLANCTMSELKLIVNKTFNKQAMITLLTEMAPSEVLTKLTTIVDECAVIAFKKYDSKDDKKEKADNIKKDKKVKVASKDVKPDALKTNDTKEFRMNHIICKQAAIFSSCYQQREEKVC